MANVLDNGELNGTIGTLMGTGNPTGIFTGIGNTFFTKIGTGSTFFTKIGTGTGFFTRTGTGNSLILGSNGSQWAEVANRASARRAIVVYG